MCSREALFIAMLAQVAVTVEPPATEPLRFAWPVPSSATVDLLVERRVGSTFRSIEVRMRLDALPESEGRTLVRLHDPRILTIDGVPFARARKDTESYDVARILRAITPSFVVGDGGEYLEDREIGRVVRAVLAEAGFEGRPLAMEAFEELVSRVGPSDWHAWTELWLGSTLAPGDGVRTREIVVFEGDLVPVTIVRKALEPGGAGRMRLETTAEFPSEAVRSYCVGFLLDLAVAADELGDDVVANRRFANEARFSPVIETVAASLEPKTLRPLEVDRTRSFWAVGGKHTVEGRERRRHRFEWDERP